MFEAFDATVAAIESDLGLPVTTVDSVFSGDIATQWFIVAAAEVAQSLSSCAASWDTFEPGLATMLHIGAGVGLSDYIAAQRLRYDAAAALSSLLGDDTVLVVPTCNATSWAPEGPLPDAAGAVTGDPAIAVNTQEFNFTGHPAVSVPIGVAPDGVPIGMQIVAPRFVDRLALGLAAALEVARPWPLTAPDYTPFGVD